MTTLDELRKLRPLLDVPAAAALLGIGPTATYTAIRAGTWPTPVLRPGRLMLIPSAPLLELLGVPARENPELPPPPPGVVRPMGRTEAP
jgi:predicted DNA-binding transcriptional regulator AlpA